MRCLHCGNEVSLLQKLTEAQFCSAEHRQKFADSQQSLILSRLEASSARLARYRRAAPNRNVAPLAAEAALAGKPPVPKGPPDPAFAELFPVTLAPKDRPIYVLGSLTISVSAAELAPPSRTPRWEHSGNLAPAVIEYPWPRYNPGLLCSTLFPFAPRADQPLLPPGFYPANDIRGLAEPPLLSIRRFRVANRPVFGAVGTVEPEINPPHVLPTLGDGVRKQRTLPSFASAAAISGPAESAAAPPLPNATTPYQEPLATPATASLPPTAQIGFVAQIPASDRLYRMRPRSGVNAPTVEIMGAEPQPASYSLSGIPASTFDLGPASAREPQLAANFRPAPPSAVDSEFVDLPATVAPIDLAGRHVNPASGAVGDTASLIPNWASGVRIASPQAAGAEQGTQFTGAEPEPLAQGLPPVAITQGLANAAPQLSEKLFRGRPRGPLTDAAIPSLVVHAPETLPVSASTATPPVWTPVASSSRLPIEASHVRSELLQGAQAHHASHFEPGSLETFVVSSAPAVPTQTLAPAEPKNCEKLYRGRPRGPVADTGVPSAIVPDPAAIPAKAAEPTPPVLKPAARSSWAPVPATQVHAVTVRPVAGTQASDLEAANVTAIATSGPPVVLTQALAPAAPLPSEKLYRGRPRGPVADSAVPSSIAPVLSIAWPEPGAPASAARHLPANPSWSPIAAADLPLTRLQPVSGSNEPNASGDSTPSILSLAASPVALTQSLTPPAPRACEKFYRGRPRGPISDSLIPDAVACDPSPITPLPADAAHATRQIALREYVPAHSTDLRTLSLSPVAFVQTQAACAATAVPSTGEPARPSSPRVDLSLAPAPCQKLYRAKPRAGLTSPTADIVTIACEPDAIAPVAPVTASAQIALWTCLAPTPISRMYRARPRAAVDAAPQSIEPADLRPIAVAAHAPVPPSLTAVELAVAPPVVNRMYRMRARAGVSDPRTLEPCGRVTAARYDPALKVELPRMPLEAVATPEPASMEKLYRMRPRNGKPSSADYLPLACVPMIGPDATAADCLEPAPARPPAMPSLKPVVRQLLDKARTVSRA